MGVLKATVKATINLQALRHNLSQVKKQALQSKVMSVIKANAYGHGVVPVAQALEASDRFAVARLEEALYLREQGISKAIVILEGVYSRDEFLQCHELHLIPVIHSLEQFQCLYELISSGCSALEYWLKIDTGMHRLGLDETDLEILIKKYQSLNSSYFPTALMSHFSSADECDNSLNQKQIAAFKLQCGLLATVLDLKDTSSSRISLSMANSAAILSLPDAHYDWVRPGIMLYGASPFSGRTGEDENLKSVMTLFSELIAIKQLKQGDCIGYGASWCCPNDMSIGVIAIGYGDGYPRHAKAGTPVLMHGIEVPLVGRVSMDMITVDLSPLQAQKKAVNVGDKAILWGDGLPIESVAYHADTIAYELLCQVTPRVSFEYT